MGRIITILLTIYIHFIEARMSADLSKAVVEVLDAHGCTLGEGPCWDPDSQTLFWIDIDQKKAHNTLLNIINT